MTSAEARKALIEGTSAEKREAARWLARNATADDREFVAKAVLEHPDHWSLAALKEALGRLDRQGTLRAMHVRDEDEVDEQLAVQDAYDRGLRDTTSMLVHELRRFVGFAKLSAGDLSDGYEGSEHQLDLDRLSSLLDAIELLGAASGTPRIEQFDLAELLVEAISREAEEFSLEIERRGPRPLTIDSDRRLVELIVRAGLRNACEAVATLGVSSSSPILVTWDQTDRDTWVSIIDEGAGPPAGLVDPFEFAATTKDGAEHFGVGLALARRAARSLGGSVELRAGTNHGAEYELRWPVARDA